MSPDPGLAAQWTATGRFVALRPLDEGDYGAIRAMEQAGPNLTHYRHRGATVAPEAYAITLWQGVACQFASATSPRAVASVSSPRMTSTTAAVTVRSPA